MVTTLTTTIELYPLQILNFPSFQKFRKAENCYMVYLPSVHKVEDDMSEDYILLLKN